MILTDYIKKLQELEDSGYGNYIVKVDDWNEEYGPPSEEQAEIIAVVNKNCRYYQIYTSAASADAEHPPFICIAPRSEYRK